MLVGPGFHFLSGMSVYTCRLANALAESHDVSVLLLNRLIPTRLYPGGHRAGKDLTSIRYDERVRIVGEVDWHWGTSMARIAAEIRRERPDVIILQWWTAATLHTYLLLARIAERLGVPIMIEFHEAQDTGEAAVPFVASYCRRNLSRLIKRSSGAIVHNRHDVLMLQSAFGAEVLQGVQLVIAPHGPYDHLPKHTPHVEESTALGADQDRRTRVLFFGLIRPYKGLEDLVDAVRRMSPDQAAQFEFDIVGETWEGWTLPAEAIAESPYRDAIRFVNRYVSDAEAAGYFAQADVLVLPYRRGSASGPLQIAMSSGIHVVMYAVGGLVEAVDGYEGATLVPPGDIEALKEAILSIVPRRDRRFEDPHSWLPIQEAIESLLTADRQ